MTPLSSSNPAYLTCGVRVLTVFPSCPLAGVLAFSSQDTSTSQASHRTGNRGVARWPSSSPTAATYRSVFAKQAEQSLEGACLHLANTRSRGPSHDAFLCLPAVDRWGAQGSRRDRVTDRG